jgi:hypothetical protein
MEKSDAKEIVETKEEEIPQEVREDSSEEVKETPPSTEEETTTQIEAIEEEVADVEEHTPTISTPKSADELIVEARTIIEEADITTQSCMEILDEDLHRYESAKSKLINESINPAQSLFVEVGFDSSIEQELGADEIDFSDIKKIKPIYVKELSSGKFGAFILALIAGLAVVVGWIYVASNALGIVVDVTKIPTPNIQDKILTWIGGGITGGEGNAMIGMAILAISAIVAIWVVYAIKVFMRETQNYKTAQKVKEDADFYCTQKEECQEKMKRISEHINSVIDAINTSKIYIDEQNATIKRILHIERGIEFENLHERSQEEINNTNILVNGIKQLISTPMATKYGTLSEDAEVILLKTQRRQETYRDKLYQ